MRIIVLRALGLGDFLTGVPAYRALRRGYKSARITLVAPRELQPLFGLIGPTLDDLVDSHDLAPLPACTHHADIAVDLHGCGPASHRVLLATNPCRLIAFFHAEIPQSLGGATYQRHEHEVLRWCRMLEHAGIPADAHELDLLPPSETAPRSVHGATLLHPGAASEARRWPVERWIDVARSEMCAGRRVVLTGSTAEMDRVWTIASHADVPARHVFAGRTNVRELAALVVASGRVVSGDTGIAHLATAYRRPSVVLFGPTPPGEWGPPPRPYHQVLWTGRRGDPHGKDIDSGLHAIPVAQVIAALKMLPA